ncbi:programmed cell death 1 ligand 1-like [Leuresthes tenuis]|uniref:programmed cell death 1 ligand 1-like n=1 Tax=Leuresthes tenuis TaxID=355514 RepID=UPI003B50DD76
MICRILLLIILTSCVCAAAFVVNVPQSSYQAEEGQSITLEWTFTTKPDSSWSSLIIFCELITDDGGSYLYHVHEGDEVSESQEEHFVGRVQSDKDALREGRISLHVSRLRTEDSGLYLCSVKNDYGSGSKRCRLNVSAAADLSQPQRPTESPQPATSGGIGLYGVMGPTGLVAVALLVILP